MSSCSILARPWLQKQGRFGARSALGKAASSRPCIGPKEPLNTKIVGIEALGAFPLSPRYESVVAINSSMCEPCGGILLRNILRAGRILQRLGLKIRKRSFILDLACGMTYGTLDDEMRRSNFGKEA